MSSEKKELNEKLSEGVTELSMEDLEQVSGGKGSSFPGIKLETAAADITAAGGGDQIIQIKHAIVRPVFESVSE